MTNEQLSAHNEAKLSELYPVFAFPVRRIIDQMKNEFNYRCRIQCAYRSPQAQLEAYNTGHSKLKFGMHNATGKDGIKEALAVDVLEDDLLFSAPPGYYIAVAHFAKKEYYPPNPYLITGIDWGLSGNLIIPLNVAIDVCDVNYTGKIGWDPSHVQYDVSSIEVKRGWRPK